MWKWAIAGMLYVTLVVFGFQAYDKWIAEEESVAVQANSHGDQEETSSAHGEEETKEASGESHESEEGGGSHSHEDNSSNHGGSQINAFVFNDENNIKVFLKDKSGNPVDDLVVNHEKLLHLIIVDEQLQKYYHLHPEKTGEGEFTISNSLSDGFYKAFIDIKSEQLTYEVDPVSFVVGNTNTSGHGHPLVPDTELSKEVDGEKVNLSINTLKVNEPVKLSFELDKTNLTPYLGAMGHVVILDEYGKKFLHVHPSNNEEPVFETQFDKPGIYKIWAEFQQNGKVRAFPFVVEVIE